MRTRAKMLTVATAMVTTFAIMPTFGAAAAEPLEDGSYDVTVGEDTYTVEVVDGSPVVEGVEGVEFDFDFSDDGLVLDEFDVTVDDVTYEVEVDDDGTVEVTADDTDDAEEEAEPEEESETEDVDELDETDEDDDPEVETDEDDPAHGELVSTVAECAPSGKVARDAGLPNHGFFVSAAAQGEDVDFEVDGESHTAELSTQEGADAFCTLAEDLLAAAAELEEASSGDGDDAPGKGRGNGNGQGRDSAPGQVKKQDG